MGLGLSKTGRAPDGVAESSTGRPSYSGFVVLGVALAGLYLTSLYSYLLFHSLAELFSIVVACALFLVAWNAREFLRNNYLLFIGVAYLFVAHFDVLHSLAYEGMGVFPDYGPNLATQLWIAARFTESLSLLAAPLFFHRRLRVEYVFAVLLTGSLIVTASIFYWKNFPVCYVQGQGLTPFKVYSEYVICLILVASMLLLMKYRDEFEPEVLRLVVASIGFMIVSELAFTFYTRISSGTNLVGHFFKIVSFYLIYKAIIETGLRRPYDLLFRELQREREALVANQDRQQGLLEEMRDFTYIVSHDLRAPLVNLKGFSAEIREALDVVGPVVEEALPSLEEPMKREVAIALQQDLPEALDFVDSSVERMHRLINAVLKLSRLGRAELNPEKIDMNRLVKEILQTFAHDINRQGVKVAVGPLPELTADLTAMEQIMSNLISNAIKYLDPERPGEIEITSTRLYGGLLFQVRDNGRGIDEGDRERIFQLFQRVGPQDTPGEGLGLTYVRTLARRLGGRLWCESKPGRGSTFFVTVSTSGSVW